MKKRILAIVMLLIASLFACMNLSQVQATDEKQLQEQMEYYTRNMDLNNITKEDILQIYDELITQYSPENIATILEENEETLEEQGISKEIVQAGAEFIKSTDTESIRNMIENEIDVEVIQEKIKQGYTADQIVSSVIEETPNEKKAEIAIKVLLANKIIKTMVIIVLVLFIYGTILRWIIYKKAGKHGWAAIIPVYRQIVMYQVCGLSPFLMLLWLLPNIGWIAMFVIAIMKRFCLAKEFGRGTLFGFGLLIFKLIFESIIAFNPQIQYTKKEEANNNE